MNKEPKLLAILGMTGSGKSVLVEMLCKQGIPKVHFDNLEFFVSEVKNAASSVLWTEPPKTPFVKKSAKAKAMIGSVVKQLLK